MARAGDAWIFAGYQITGYTDEEESQGGPGDAAPFTLESRLRAEAPHSPRARPGPVHVANRDLITGQNPGSAAAVARQLVTALAGSESFAAAVTVLGAFFATAAWRRVMAG